MFCVFFQSFKEDLQNRENQLKTVLKTGAELKSKASAADAETIGRQLEEMNTSWSKVVRMSDRRTSRLEEALKDVIIIISTKKHHPETDDISLLGRETSQVCAHVAGMAVGR